MKLQRPHLYQRKILVMKQVLVIGRSNITQDDQPIESPAGSPPWCFLPFGEKGLAALRERVHGAHGFPGEGLLARLLRALGKLGIYWKHLGIDGFHAQFICINLFFAKERRWKDREKQEAWVKEQPNLSEKKASASSFPFTPKKQNKNLPTKKNPPPHKGSNPTAAGRFSF